MSEDSINKVILEEIRELRKSVDLKITDHGERLSAVETHVHGLVGNGQPGTIDEIKEDIRSLNKFRYYLTGAIAVIETVGHYVVKRLNLA